MGVYMSNLTDLISAGGGGSASQIDEVVFLNNGADTVTLDDGRVYLKGGVYETTISSYPDATTTFTYTGTGDAWLMDSGGSGFWEPEGMTHDGTVFWATGYRGNNDDSVRSFNTAGVEQSVFTIGSQVSRDTARGIAWDGSHLWVLALDGGVFKYTTGGTYQNVTWSANAQTGSNAHSIEWDGSHFWVLSRGSRRMFKYNSSGVYQNVSFTLDSSFYYPTGLTWDGNNFWIVCDGPDLAVEYTPSGTFTGRSFYPNSSVPSDIAVVGTDLWVVDTYKNVMKFVPAIGISEYSVQNYKGQIGEGNNYVRVK
jgi:hypothetical protein